MIDLVKDDQWPTHPDGRRKRFGELTPDQRLTQIKRACDRLQRDFNDPEVRQSLAIGAVVNDLNE